MIQIAVSSWTLHNTLGRAWHDLENPTSLPQDAIPLLDLPKLVAENDIHVLELCHFHLPSIDDAYLAELKSALQTVDVRLANLLIDTGNISSLDDAERDSDINTIKRWQDVAAVLGADGVRIDCGLELATPESIARAADALRELADYGASLGIKTGTENWRTTSIYPDNLLEIMRRTDRDLNLCVDFGNAAKTDDKYGTLEKLMPQATSIHCKAVYDVDDTINDIDLSRCLTIARDANFDGHISLIYDSGGNELMHIADLKRYVERFFMVNPL